MANEQNLKPIKHLSTEEAKKRGSKGGKKSGEARRKKRDMKEQMRLLLSLPVTDAKNKAALKKLGIDADNIDNQMMLLLGLYKASMRGSVQAFQKIQELVMDAKDIVEMDTTPRIVVINTLPECEEIDNEPE